MAGRQEGEQEEEEEVWGAVDGAGTVNQLARGRGVGGGGGGGNGDY